MYRYPRMEGVEPAGGFEPTTSPEVRGALPAACPVAQRYGEVGRSPRLGGALWVEVWRPLERIPDDQFNELPAFELLQKSFCPSRGLRGREASQSDTDPRPLSASCGYGVGLMLLKSPIWHA